MNEDILLQLPSRPSSNATVWLDIKDITALGLSLTFTHIVVVALNLTIMYYAGRLPTSDLDGVGLALTLFNLTGFSLANGLGAACETLFSQAYGSPNKKKVGIYLQRAFVFFAVGFVFTICTNINSNIIFELLGQDPVIACVARRFLVISILAYASYFTQRVLVVYLRVQDIYWPMVIGVTLAAVGAAVSGYVLVDEMRLGLDGVALSYLFFISLHICGSYGGIHTNQ